MGGLGLLVDKATRDMNRNRFLVRPVDDHWVVVRVGHKGGLSFVLAFKHKQAARDMEGKLNDMYEEGVIY